MPPTFSQSMATQINGILAAVDSLLQAAAGEGEALEGLVSSINRGDRARLADIRPPALWIFPGSDVIQPSGGVANEHAFDIVLVAIVQGRDPGEALAANITLLGTAYDVLLADPTWSGNVHAVRPTRFDPAADRFVQAQRQLYAATAVFQARFRRRE